MKMSLVLFKSLVIAWHAFEVVRLMSRFEWSRRLLDAALAGVFVMSILLAALIPVLWWVVALCCLWCS